MVHWPHWTLFFLACLAAVLLAKVLDERDRRLRRAASRARAESDPPRPIGLGPKSAETPPDCDRDT